jgi:hypothetical protein
LEKKVCLVIKRDVSSGLVSARAKWTEAGLSQPLIRLSTSKGLYINWELSVEAAAALKSDLSLAEKVSVSYQYPLLWTARNIYISL